MINTANNWSRTQGWFILGQTRLKAFHPQHYTTHYCHWQITLALFACCWNLKTFHTAKITSVCCHIDTNVVFVVLQLLPCSALSCVPNDLQVRWIDLTPLLKGWLSGRIYPFTLTSFWGQHLHHPSRSLCTSWSWCTSSRDPHPGPRLFLLTKSRLEFILLITLMPKSRLSEVHLPGLSKCTKKFYFFLANPLLWKPLSPWEVHQEWLTHSHPFMSCNTYGSYHCFHAGVGASCNSWLNKSTRL